MICKNVYNRRLEIRFALVYFSLFLILIKIKFSVNICDDMTLFHSQKVLNEALENRGIASEVKAKLRAEVYNILEDNASPKPSVSQENLLINELIREYMEFNRYRYSKSVFLKGTLQYTLYSTAQLFGNIRMHVSKQCYSLLFTRLFCNCKIMRL